MTPDHPELAEALDRYGSDLDAWPDRARAAAFREAALADRTLRARLDEARRLDRALLGLRAAMDAEIAASGGAERVVEAVARKAGRRRAVHRWAAAAAAVVVAAGLGSLYDFRILAPDDGGRPVEVVILDPLVFGPAESIP